MDRAAEAEAEEEADMNNQYDPVTIAKSSCLDLDLIFKDSSGAVEDITDDTFTIGDALPLDVFVGAEIRKIDPLAGLVRLHLDERLPETLYTGNVNWFRINRTFVGGCVDMTEQIYVRVV